MYYFNAFGSNFGDALSPKIVQMVSGLRDKAAMINPEDENVAGDLDVINGGGPPRPLTLNQLVRISRSGLTHIREEEALT